MKKSLLFSTVLTICLCVAFIGSAQANYFDKTTSSGQYRVFYKSPSPATCDAFVLGVGTAMSRDSYDNLAAAMSNYGYIVVVMDHQPGSMTKTDANKYKNCVIEVQNNILGWMSGTGCTAISYWILAGTLLVGRLRKTLFPVTRALLMRFSALIPIIAAAPAL